MTNECHELLFELFFFRNTFTINFFVLKVNILRRTKKNTFYLIF